MPIFDKDVLLGSTISTPKEIVEDTQESIPDKQSSFMDTLSASFKLDNTVFNVAKELVDTDPDTSGTNIDYNPFINEGEKLKGYEFYADKFIGANSDQDIEIIKFDIDYEEEQKEIIANAPTWSKITSMMLANTIDPLTLIPLTRVLSMATKAGRAAQGALQGTGFGLLSGLGREGTLQASQETRSKRDSIINILTESALGGILGASVGALSGAQRAGARLGMGKALQGEDFKVRINDEGMPQVDKSVGASEVVNVLEGEGLHNINENLAKAIGGGGIEHLKSPTLRGVTSSFGKVRQLTNKLFQHNFILKKETKGFSRGDVAENLIRQDDAKLTLLNKEVENLYLNYTGVGKYRSLTKITRPEGKLSYANFNTRISRVLRDGTIIDDLPQVNKAAKLYRKQLDDIAKDMQELKLLPDDLDPKTARNYLSRIYDTDKLSNISVRKRFINKVSDHYKTHKSDGTLRVEPLDDDLAQSLAEETLDKIKREGDASLVMNTVSEQIMSKGKFNKERVLLIEDSELEEFLVNDAEQIVTNYSRRASAIMRTQKALNELGHDSLGDFKIGLKAEKDRALLDVVDTKKRVKIEKDFNKDLQLTDDMYRLMTGSLRKPGTGDRFTRTLLAYQFTRLLGGVVVSSIPELAMAPFRHGLLNTLKDGYLPMLKSWKTAKLARDQLKDLDVGLENEINNVLRSITDTGVDAGVRQTEYDRLLGTVTHYYGKLTGLNKYTAFGRRLGASVSMSSIVRKLKKFQKKGKLSTKEITELANSGIAKTDYEKILVQIDKYSDERNGSFIANPHLWNDADALNVFKRAVQNEVESIILKPSKGDIPILAQKSNVGKLLFQFKSFSSAATNKIAISSLQRRDMRTLMGLTQLTALGTVSGMIKDKLAGREITDNPVELITDGIARSGIAGLLATTALDGSLIMSNKKARRFGGKFIQGSLLGPTIGGTLGDIGDIMARLSDGDVSNSDIKAGVRAVPLSNLFYIQYLTNKAFSE